MKYTKEKEVLICSLFEDGLSPTEIAKQFQTYNTTIRRILLRNNYTLKGPSEAQRVVKINKFLNLDIDEVQYWLGFLIADGNLSFPNNSKKYTIDISVAELDKTHLIKYCNFIGHNLIPKKYLNKKYNSYLYSVRFGNKNIHEFLCSLGITPRKSKTLELKIPLTWSILRGVMDGDGHIKKLSNNRNNIEIATGSNKFFNQIKKFLIKNGIKSTGEFKNNIGIIRICTQSDVRMFAKNIYQNNTICLQRKYNRLGPSTKKFIEEHTTNSGKP